MKSYFRNHKPTNWYFFEWFDHFNSLISTFNSGNKTFKLNKFIEMCMKTFTKRRSDGNVCFRNLKTFSFNKNRKVFSDKTFAYFKNFIQIMKSRIHFKEIKIVNMKKPLSSHMYVVVCCRAFYVEQQFFDCFNKVI